MDNIVILLVGKSGSGKTTIADMLAEKYNLSVLKSYTTRLPRVNDDSHIFVSIEEFNKLENKIAYTEFNGNYYCATADQLDNSDIYVIDPDGIKYLKEHYHGSKRLIDIYIDCDEETCRNRMKQRGDTYEQIESRISNDKTKFDLQKYKPSKIISNNEGRDLNTLVDTIYHYAWIIDTITTLTH